MRTSTDGHVHVQGDNRELQFTIWESLKAIRMKDLNQDSWVTPQKLEALVAGGSVDQLTENVGVPAVSRVLLDQVEIYPTKINRFATGTRLLHELF